VLWADEQLKDEYAKAVQNLNLPFFLFLKAWRKVHKKGVGILMGN